MRGLVISKFKIWGGPNKPEQRQYFFDDAKLRDIATRLSY